VTGILGVSPPTFEEYSSSCNHNLLIPIPLDNADDHLAVEEGDFQYYM
jgi:hypothetical protein